MSRFIPVWTTPCSVDSRCLWHQCELQTFNQKEGNRDKENCNPQLKSPFLSPLVHVQMNMYTVQYEEFLLLMNRKKARRANRLCLSFVATSTLTPDDGIKINDVNPISVPPLCSFCPLAAQSINTSDLCLLQTRATGYSRKDKKQWNGTLMMTC